MTMIMVVNDNDDNCDDENAKYKKQDNVDCVFSYKRIVVLVLN